MLEVPECVGGAQVGLPVQAGEFRERVHNAHYPFNFLSELRHSCVYFEEVYCYYFSWVRAMFESAVSVLVFWIVDGFG